MQVFGRILLAMTLACLCLFWPPAAAGRTAAPSINSYRSTYGLDFAVLPDGGALLAGSNLTSDGQRYAYWLARIEPDGGIRWERLYGSEIWIGKASVAAMPDGGFALAGIKTLKKNDQSTLWILRTDSEGNPKWEKTLANRVLDRTFDLAALPDGGLVVTANAFSDAEWAASLWRLDGLGNVVWKRSFNEPNDPDPYALALLPDQSTVIVGLARSKVAGANVWVARVDAKGKPLWERTFGGKQTDDYGRAVTAFPNGDVGIVGTTESNGSGKRDVWVLRVNGSGRLLWDRVFGGIKNDDGYAVAALQDGGMAVAAHTRSWGLGSRDIWVLRLDAEGHLLWDWTFGTRLSDRVFAVAATGSDHFMVVSDSLCPGSTHVWTRRLRADMPPKEASESNLGLGITRLCVQSALEEDGMRFRKAGKANGNQRIVGEAPSGRMLVELIGPETNLLRASISVPLQHTNHLGPIAGYFLYLVKPDWGGHWKWLEENLLKLEQPPHEVKTVIDHHQLTMRIHPDLKVTRISIEALQ